MKKRIISLILSVVLTMACFVFPANAVEPAATPAVTVTTTASATTVSRGDTFTISVTLPEKIVRVSAGAIMIEYDETVVEFNSMTGAQATKENKWIVPNEESDATEFFPEAESVLAVKTFKPVDKQGMIAYDGCVATLEGEIFTAKFKQI